MFVCISLFVCLMGCISVNEPAQKFERKYEGKKIVGYFPAKYAMSERYTVGTEYLTHLILWFFNPDELYNFYCEKAEVEKVKQLIRIAKREGCKVFLSIGGGHVNGRSKYAPRYRFLLRPENFPLFAEKLIDLVKVFEVDGIDLDLEGDMILEGFSEFICFLKTKLEDKNIELSGAFNIWGGRKLTHAAIHSFDFINLMAYNESGLFEKRLKHHSSFPTSQKHLDYWTKKRGISPDRVILGVPFYGWYKEFDLSYNLLNKKAVSYSYIHHHFPQLTLYDNFVEIHTDVRRIVFTYNSMELIRKKTSLSRKYGGIMIWQLTQDTEGLVLLKIVADTMLM